MGLRYEEEQVDAIIEGVSAMLYGIRGIEESSVYQGILRKGEAEGRAEGEAEGIRDALLISGRKKLGPPDEKISARIAEIHNLGHLKRLLERILDVSGWDDLLAQAIPRHKPKQRAPDRPQSSDDSIQPALIPARKPLTLAS